MSAVDTIRQALEAARECIKLDRTSLADCHMRPDNTMDECGKAGLAQYDAVLDKIGAGLEALSMLQPESGDLVLTVGVDIQKDGFALSEFTLGSP